MALLSPFLSSWRTAMLNKLAFSPSVAYIIPVLKTPPLARLHATILASEFPLATFVNSLPYSSPIWYLFHDSFSLAQRTFKSSLACCCPLDIVFKFRLSAGAFNFRFSIFSYIIALSAYLKVTFALLDYCVYLSSFVHHFCFIFPCFLILLSPYHNMVDGSRHISFFFFIFATEKMNIIPFISNSSSATLVILSYYF